MTNTDVVESHVLTDQVVRVTDRLRADYAGRVTEDEVRRLVDEAFDRFGHARITQFVPVLVDRSVRDQLRRATP